MQIIVCVKQIFHTYARTGRDPSKDYIADEDRVVRTNPYDEAAMEVAARLKETERGARITVVTLGPVLSEKELRRCLAFGADECLHTDCPGSLDPWAKAGVLARIVRSEKGDLVLCGRESLDQGNAQVGPFLAHRLGMPFMGPLLAAEVDWKGKKVRGIKKGERGVRQTLECPVPAVFTVDLGGVEIRLPSYEERTMAKEVPVRRVGVDETLITSRTRQVRVFPPRPRAQAVPTPDARLPAEKRIEFLLSGSLVEKKGETLNGDAEDCVQGILKYLEKEDFLEPF